jgi:hypothetical protein
MSSSSFSGSISLLAFSASSRQSLGCGVMEVPLFASSFLTRYSEFQERV